VRELQGIGRDITDRKRAEEATQRLALVSRLAVMGELTASIAHEVNQPLNAILNNADAAELLLEADSPRLDEVRRILADIRSDDLRASEVIRRTRDLLRKRPMEFEALDLNGVAAGVLQLVRNEAARRRVELASELAPDLPAVPGDRVHLEQVLLNLVLNAMEAMGDAQRPVSRITVRTARVGAEVEVTVTDSGHGVDPSDLPKIFDSFFTTKKEGMGLGLSIARSILEGHGGRIWAENGQEGGATFHFIIPTERD
jgi:signal transduction histidine kinase